MRGVHRRRGPAGREPFGQGSNRGIPAGEAVGSANPQCFGLEPSRPNAPALASTAPMGATPIPAPPTILCAFCGHPPPPGPLVLEATRLASPGDGPERGPGQNLQKTRCKRREAKPFRCPKGCNFSLTPHHPCPASSSVRSAPIEPPAAYPSLAGLPLHWPNKARGARSADQAMRRCNRRHGSTQAGTGALRRPPPPAPILTDFPTPRRSGFTLLPSGAQRGLLQKCRRAVAPPTTCYRKCHVAGTWRSNCFPVDHKPQADARRGAHLNDYSFPPYPD